MVRRGARQRAARRDAGRAVGRSTHELEWHPGWAHGGIGAWGLCAHGTKSATCWRGDLPQGIRASILAGWAAGHLGCPVILTPGWTARFRADHTHEYCRMYWVTPACLLSPRRRHAVMDAGIPPLPQGERALPPEPLRA